MSAAETASTTVIERRRPDGSSTGPIELDPAVFGIEPNMAVMHQVVTAQLAAARAGTHSTKTRAEVKGGGAKPYRQKGTGRARQGSNRAPQWVGGGVALGPKPRRYGQRTPKKMVKLALHSALSDRASRGRVLVVDWDFEQPKTKEAAAALVALGVRGKALVVVERNDWVVGRSFSNLSSVQVMERSELNAYDVLRNEWVIFSESTLPTSSSPSAQKVEEATAEGAGTVEEGGDEGGEDDGGDER